MVTPVYLSPGILNLASQVLSTPLLQSDFEVYTRYQIKSS
jgi:hypothetical protein